MSDELETGAETNAGTAPKQAESGSTNGAAPAPRRPRAKLERIPGVVDFGAVPATCRAWRIGRQGFGGQEEMLSAPSPDGGVQQREWPIEELSEATIRMRWGAGTYRVHFYGIRSDRPGAVQFMHKGKVFTLLDAAPAYVPPPPAPPPAPTPAQPSGLELAMQFMALADQRANAQLSGMAKLVEVMERTRGGGGGIDGQVLALLLDKQAATMRDALRDQADAFRAELARIRQELGGEPEPEPGALATVAGAAQAASTLPESMDLQGLFKWAMANPTQAMQTLQLVPGAVDAVRSLAKLVPQQEVPPAPRPRAVRIVEAPAASAPPSPAQPSTPAPATTPNVASGG